MNRSLLALLFVLVTASLASAQTPSGRRPPPAKKAPVEPAKDSVYGVYGQGTKSCGQWSTDSPNARDRFTNVVWVLGFVSGVGFAGSSPPPKTDSEAITHWIDNYCATNPLVTVDQAAEELVRALWRTVP